MWLFKPDTLLHVEDWRRSGHIMKQDNGGHNVVASSDRAAVITRKTARLNSKERKADPRFKRYSWSWSGKGS